MTQWPNNARSVVDMSTSVAHSCSVPTTGMSMFSWVDLRSRARSGIAPAFRMLSLLRWLLEQLHSARAPERATSTSFFCSFVVTLLRDEQSRRATWTHRGQWHSRLSELLWYILMNCHCLILSGMIKTFLKKYSKNWYHTVFAGTRKASF